MNALKQIFICQHRSCTKDNSAAVLKAFRDASLEGVIVHGCGCLGLCGSGPIVLVAEEQIYYWHVKPQDVQTLIKQHLKGGKIVKSLLHPRLHANDLYDF